MWLARLLAPLVPPLCLACGGHAGRSEPLCLACRGDLRWLDPALERLAGMATWAPLAYEGPARAVVRSLKYDGVRGAAAIMAAQVAANAPPRLLAGRTLVPVPPHPTRRRRRGFNQAELLARALGARAGIEVADCLRRTGSRRPQVGRAREERLGAIEGAISPSPGVHAPKRPLLVDDVITTGAMLGACARALREGGAFEVAAIAYARTPGR